MYCIFLLSYAFTVAPVIAIPLAQYINQPQSYDTDFLTAPQVIAGATNQVSTVLTADKLLDVGTDGHQNTENSDLLPTPYLIGIGGGGGFGQPDEEEFIGGMSPEEKEYLDYIGRLLGDDVSEEEKELQEEIKNDVETARRKAAAAPWNFSNLQNKAARLGQRIGIGFQRNKISIGELNLNSAHTLPEAQIQSIIKILKTKIKNGDRKLANLDPRAVIQSVSSFAAGVGIALQGPALVEAVTVAMPEILESLGYALPLLLL